MHTNNIFGSGMGFSDFTDKETGSIGGENGIRFGNSFNFFDDLKIRVGLGSFLGQGLELGGTGTGTKEGSTRREDDFHRRA